MVIKPYFITFSLQKWKTSKATISCRTKFTCISLLSEALSSLLWPMPHILYREPILQATQAFHHSQKKASFFHTCNLCEHSSLFLECPSTYRRQLKPNSFFWLRIWRYVKKTVIPLKSNFCPMIHLFTDVFSQSLEKVFIKYQWCVSHWAGDEEVMIKK